MAKQLAYKYGNTAGRWCNIYYTASMMEIQCAPLADWKFYIQILRGE